MTAYCKICGLFLFLLLLLKMNMSCLKQTERAKTYFQEMESVRKKLIKMENDF